METRQRRPEELGLLQALGAGSSLESPRVVPTPPGPELSRETAWSIGIQVTLPFLFAGLGLSGAGILLHYFQHWPVFTEMKDLLTLVPPLVGLKGNLEMTLASRLSTAANTGQIDDPREQYRVVSSNLALVQVQAAVVGLLAAVAALLLGLASGQGLDVVEAQVLCASSVLTASLAACALGTLMVCIVVGARKLGVNPDNIATPIAASLGDLITLSLLAVVSSFFYRHRDSQYLTPLVCVGFAVLTPACVLIAKQNPPVVRILKFGWFPIVLAMLVSSLGGLILNKTLYRPQFRGMAVFAPIMCGGLWLRHTQFPVTPGAPQAQLSRVHPAPSPLLPATRFPQMCPQSGPLLSGSPRPALPPPTPVPCTWASAIETRGCWSRLLRSEVSCRGDTAAAWTPPSRDLGCLV
ncbi:solute carrier family 41 member 3 isoform X2 [Odocoileus virginianus]|uniref:Solute carrier family 41 member n=1 Tax=Odocoileus virginianus TaxID=9874 RepID=A0ABM4HVK2_ODOVR